MADQSTSEGQIPSGQQRLPRQRPEQTSSSVGQEQPWFNNNLNLELYIMFFS